MHCIHVPNPRAPFSMFKTSSALIWNMMWAFVSCEGTARTFNLFP